MPLAERAKLVLERDPLVALGAVDNVDKHFGQRLRHAFGLFVRAAPLGLTGSEAASDPGLRTARFTRRSPPWAGLVPSGRALGWLRSVPSGRAAKRRRKSFSSPAPRRGVLKTETRDRLFVVYSSDSEQKLKTPRAGGGYGFHLRSEWGGDRDTTPPGPRSPGGSPGSRSPRDGHKAAQTSRRPDRCR
mgnify:CR=1 FL=1